MVVTLISSDGDKMLRQWWCCREDNDCENDDGGGWIWQFSHKFKKKKSELTLQQKCGEATSF